jgi:undecaprenyl-phosphate 4-deoxy-4-formamido-L-arabinose transferase
MAQPAVSIVVPVFNSEGSLGELVRRIDGVRPALGGAVELILVNDASRDRSWEVVQQIAANTPWARGVSLMRNYGQHNAVLCGIRLATGTVVVTMDDDLQNPPEEIPKLLVRLDEGFDVVYGSPARHRHSLVRNLAAFSTKLALQGVLGAEAARHIGPFRAFRADLRRAFERFDGAYVNIDVLLTWGTTKFGVCEVRHDPRAVGTSNYTLAKLAAHSLNMVTGFSILPLQMASMLGFLTTAVGAVGVAFVLGLRVLAGRSVSSVLALASLTSLLAGVQLLALGVIGEYLARIHFRMLQRPPYVVRVEPGATVPS